MPMDIYFEMNYFMEKQVLTNRVMHGMWEKLEVYNRVASNLLRKGKELEPRYIYRELDSQARFIIVKLWMVRGPNRKCTAYQSNSSK
jgi:hypothetical protein